MPRRRIDNVDKKIIAAIIKIGAAEGVKQVSADKITKVCGISDSTVYAHYKTKQDYLDAAAKHFDRKYMQKVSNMLRENNTAEEIWDKVIGLFLTDPDGAMYYNNYIQAFGFDVTKNNPRAEEFLESSKYFFSADKPIDDDTYLLLWDYITSMAFYYSEKIIHNYLPNTPKVRSMIKRLVFDGINGLLK